MPQFFEEAVMTNSGSALLARSMAEGVAIDFIGIAVGNGSYTNQEKTKSALRQRTALKSLQVSYTPSAIIRDSSDSVRISALITNVDPDSGEAVVEAGFYINEIGVIAQPHDEATDPILFSISVTSGTQGDYMPAYTGTNPAQIVQGYVTRVSNEATVNMSAPVSAYALAEDLQALSEVVEGISVQIVDDLNSTSSNKALSAKQGNILNNGLTELRTAYSQVARVEEETLIINSDLDLTIDGGDSGGNN